MKIRAAEPRKQIWRPSKEPLDLRALLLLHHHWVRLRTQVQNALRAIALAVGDT